MLRPAVTQIITKNESCYSLVIAVAKRARQLNEGANKLVDCNSEKEVSIAVDEVNGDKITYIRTKSGIK